MAAECLWAETEFSVKWPERCSRLFHQGLLYCSNVLFSVVVFSTVLSLPWGFIVSSRLGTGEFSCVVQWLTLFY